jgi:hypothetical protein
MKDETVQVRQDGDKFVAIYNGVIVAKERTEHLARDCAQARIKAGLFG